MVLGIATSCVKRTVVVQRETTVIKKDNGNHNGWYKNPHNPHNPGRGGNTTVVVVEQNNGYEQGHGKGKKHKR